MAQSICKRHPDTMLKFFIIVIICSVASGATVLPRLSAKLLMKSGWRPISPAIVGGEEAVMGEFPYQASLQKLSVLGTWSHSCGASIYDSLTALTAAHCVYGVNASLLQLVAGEHSLLYYSGQEQAMKLDYLVHPSYDAVKLENDIAILHLNKTLKFNAYISPIVIPEQNTNTKAGTDCVVTGWGTTYPGDPNTANILRKVDVPIVSDETCSASYGPDVITTHMICAGFKDGGKDACQGDSGGALVIKGTKTQVGIVSFGNGCGTPGYYGVYTKVSSYSNWIRENSRGTPTNNAISQFSSCLLILFLSALILIFSLFN